jgi:hypothetical protein
MSERPVITAQLIVAAASRRWALIIVAAANNAAMTQKISLSGITITLTRDYPQKLGRTRRPKFLRNVTVLLTQRTKPSFKEIAGEGN